jgi:chaperonin GroEL (HSP60 family)
MFGSGIIYLTKVVRAALEDASSVVGLLITTHAIGAESRKRRTLLRR